MKKRILIFYYKQMKISALKNGEETCPQNVEQLSMN